MKKIAAFALLATAAAAASAQSSVTLFGVVDANVRHVKNGDDSVNSMSNNGLSSSRLGFRGVEDLGGGLKASFWLEHGFNVDTGTPSDASRYWNRRSTVSLSGGFGELRLGRDFSPTYSAFAAFDVFGTNGIAAADKFNSTLGSGADTGTRSDNLVSYFLPGSLGGLYGQVSIAPEEGALGKKYAGARIGYAVGPLDVAVGYGRTDVAPVAGEDTFETAIIGASYNFGVVKLTGYYQRNEAGNQKLTNVHVGASVPLGNGLLRASYVRADLEGRNAAGANVDANDADQFAIGYVHNLSKRTALYATYAVVDNEGAAAFAVASSPALVAGRKSTGYEFGIRHSF